MKFGKDAILRVCANRLTPEFAQAFSLPEDETREHLMCALDVAWQGLLMARTANQTGALKRDVTVAYSSKVL